MTVRAFIRLAAAALLGLAAALLVSCGGSGKGLIPAARATPLQSDFETVARAAESGNGSCAGTETALAKTEQDFLGLPATVDPGLRGRLREGISNLRKRALAMCAQPATTVTTATTAPTTTPTTTPAQTAPTTTTAPPTTPTSPPSSEGGGTAAPGEAEGEEGKGKGKDKGESEGDGSSGGASAGGASAGGGR